MAENDTNIFWEILQSFNLGDMLLAFSLSVLVGLLLGALVYVLLTWASRRQASARITRRSKRKSPRPCTPPSSQLGLCGSPFLSVYRQPSLEPVGQLGSKPRPEASTFRPPCSKKKPPLEEDARGKPPEQSEALVANKRYSFWLGGNGLKGFLPIERAPPAYDAAVHPPAETST